MNPIQGATSSFPLFGVFSPATVSAGSQLTSGLFDQNSSVLALSSAGQLLSAASLFQGQMLSLLPGAANGGTGQNFGNDVASLAAEAQFVVDAVNGVQQGLSSNGPLTGSGQAIALTQNLASVAQSSFDNGTSSLTQLSQLGITAQTSALGTSTLSINLGTLQSAFTADPAGAFSLLGQAVQAFAAAAGTTVAQAQSNVGTLGIIAGLNVFQQFFGNGGLLSNNSGLDFTDLLLLESLSVGTNNGGNSALTNLLGISQFNLVSALL